MTSKPMLWTGRVISGLVALMLLASGVTKFIKMPGQEEGLAHIGWSASMMPVLGVIEIVSVLLYLIPQTAVVGAILLTGYMGGAIATHLRVGDAVVIQVILPIVVWLGIFLRDARLRALLPWRDSGVPS